MESYSKTSVIPREIEEKLAGIQKFIRCCATVDPTIKIKVSSFWGHSHVHSSTERASALATAYAERPRQQELRVSGPKQHLWISTPAIC